MTKKQIEKRIAAAMASVAAGRADLEGLLDEMCEYRDEHTEKWQEGDKGSAFCAAIEAVEEAIDALVDVEQLEVDF